jgi:hypothetical protein
MALKSSWVVAAAACLGMSQASSAEEGRPHFELIKTKEEPAQTVPEWEKTLAPGKITLEAPFGDAECTWSEPPQNIYIEGFTIDLSISLTAEKGTNFASNIDVRAGLKTMSDGPMEAKAYAENGGADFQTVSVTLAPFTFDYLNEESMIYVLIGGCNAGGVTYTYAYRAN